MHATRVCCRRANTFHHGDLRRSRNASPRHHMGTGPLSLKTWTVILKAPSNFIATILRLLIFDEVELLATACEGTDHVEFVCRSATRDCAGERWQRDRHRSHHWYWSHHGHILICWCRNGLYNITLYHKNGSAQQRRNHSATSSYLFFCSIWRSTYRHMHTCIPSCAIQTGVI